MREEFLDGAVFVGGHHVSVSRGCASDLSAKMEAIDDWNDPATAGKGLFDGVQVSRGGWEEVGRWRGGGKEGPNLSSQGELF